MGLYFLQYIFNINQMNYSQKRSARDTAADRGPKAKVQRHSFRNQPASHHRCSPSKIGLQVTITPLPSLAGNMKHSRSCFSQ